MGNSSSSSNTSAASSSSTSARLPPGSTIIPTPHNIHRRPIRYDSRSVDDLKNESSNSNSNSNGSRTRELTNRAQSSSSSSTAGNKKQKKKDKKGESNGVTHTHSFNHLDELDRQLYEPNDNTTRTDNDGTLDPNGVDERKDDIASSTLNDLRSRQSSVSSNNPSIRSSHSSVNSNNVNMLSNNVNSNNVSPSRLDCIVDEHNDENENDENDDVEERKVTSRNITSSLSADSELGGNRYAELYPSSTTSTSCGDDEHDNESAAADGLHIIQNAFRDTENIARDGVDDAPQRSPSTTSLNGNISSTTSSSSSIANATVLPQSTIMLHAPRDTPSSSSSRQRSASSYIPRSSITTNTSTSTSTASPSSNPISFLSTLIGGGGSSSSTSSSSSSSSTSARDALINSRSSRQSHVHAHGHGRSSSTTSPPPSLAAFNRLGRSTRRFHGALGMGGGGGDMGDIHIGVSCDLCQSSPIRGVRYKCEVCTDYDLCSNCYTTFNIELGDHKPDHPMRRIERSHRSGYSSQAEQFIRMLLNAGYNNVRLVSRESDPEYEERYRAFMEEAFYNGPKGVSPASQRAIDALPVSTITSDHDILADGKECQICMEAFELNEEVMEMKCKYKHIYHSVCLKLWLNEHATCPIDRERIETSDEYAASLENAKSA